MRISKSFGASSVALQELLHGVLILPLIFQGQTELPCTLAESGFTLNARS